MNHTRAPGSQSESPGCQHWQRAGRTPRRVAALCAALALCAAELVHAAGSSQGQRSVGAGIPTADERHSIASVAAAMEALAPAFVENRGQWPEPTRFACEVAGALVRVEPRAIGLQLRQTLRASSQAGTYVRLEFEGASPETVIEGEAPLPGRYSYFEGSDASRWVSSVPSFAALRCAELYPGIDLRLREQRGLLEYDLVLQPSARLDDVVIRCEGADAVCVEPDGTLVIETSAGPVRQRAPRTWYVVADGTTHEVACSFEVLGTGRFGFSVAERRPGEQLVIDPGLEWSTYLGYSKDEELFDLVVHPSGDPIVTGYTVSPEFATTPGAYAGSGTWRTSIVRLNSDASAVVYSAIVGSIIGGRGIDLALDGGPVVVGSVNGGSLPATPGAFATTPDNQNSGFVLRLTPDASALVFATYLGGNASETAYDVAVDATGVITVVGETCSSDFPTTPGAFDTMWSGTLPTSCGNTNGFVTRLKPDGSSLIYSTYLGGDQGFSFPGASGPHDYATGVAVDSSGCAIVVGWTYANDFPVTPGALKTVVTEDEGDGFVTKLTPDGSALVFSTYLGGTFEERARAVALGPGDAINVVGRTTSYDFPVTLGAFDIWINFTGAPTGFLQDGFLVRLDPGGNQLFGTFLGGGSDDDAMNVAVDASGVTTVAGITYGASFPVTPGAYSEAPLFWGDYDFFVGRVSPSGDRLFYATFFGGIGDNPPAVDVGLGLNASGSAIVASRTLALDFPVTPGVVDPTPSGGADGVLFQLDMLPTGVAKYGRATPSCLGLPAMGVTMIPLPGVSGFGLTCSAAPPGGRGLLLLSGGSAAAGIAVAGAQAWIDPAQLFAAIGITADAHGYVEMPLTPPGGTQGLSFFAQYGFLATPTCPSSGPVCASNALAITVQ